MKKTLLLAALIAGGAAPVSAQGLEFSGGVNFAKLSGADIQNAAQNLGLNFGLDLVIPVGPVGLNVGGGWSQKGAEVSEAASSTILDLSYIEIPVHLRLPLVGAGPIRLNLILGPTIGINTGCELTLDSGSAEACADSAEGFDVNKLDWSGAAGLGVSFRLGGLAYAGADLKYALGFTSIDEGSQELKNKAFSLEGHVGFDVF